MTANRKVTLLSIALAALCAMPSTRAQSLPKNWPPKPLELTANPQVIITRAPQAASDQLHMLANDPWASEPELEKTRLAAEPKDAGAKIKIDAKFDCGTIYAGKKLTPTHFHIDFNSQEVYMFYFRITGVAGKTVRIDLKTLNPTNLAKMQTLNPVVSEDLAPDEMPTIGSEVPFTAKTTTVDNGGVGSIQLPDTGSQSWHFIDDVWVDQENKTLSFVHTFTKDTALVAMKYPYSPGLNEKYFEQWAKSPHAKAITLGASPFKQRPLQLIRITDIPEGREGNHPSVVIYGREHANEHDPSWACKGAIDFLLGDSPEAAKLRQQVIFHIIPVLDVDAAIENNHIGIIQSFSKRAHFAKENLLYAEYFQQWVDSGGSLDLVLNLHNVESAEQSYHLSVAQIEPQEARLALSTAFDTLLAGSLNKQGFRGSAEGDTGYFPFRLSGWLDDTFGALPFVYELNSQEPHRHLLLSELTAIGATLAKSAGEFVTGTNGNELRESADAVLRVRKAAKAATNFTKSGSVFDSEYALKEWRAKN